MLLLVLTSFLLTSRWNGRLFECVSYMPGQGFNSDMSALNMEVVSA